MLRLFLVNMLSIFVISGCSSGSESKSVAVASPSPNTIVSVDGEMSQVVEIDTNETEIRLGVYKGQFVFGNEDEYSSTFYKPGAWENRNGDLTWSRPKPWRSTIQGAIKQRYPDFAINRILRVKEKDGTFYYVSLKRNHLPQ